MIQLLNHKQVKFAQSFSSSFTFTDKKYNLQLMNQFQEKYQRFKDKFRTVNQNPQNSDPINNANLVNARRNFEGQNIFADQLLQAKRKLRQFTQKNPLGYLNGYDYQAIMKDQEEYQKMIRDFPQTNLNFPATQPENEEINYKGKDEQKKRQRTIKQINISQYMQHHEYFPERATQYKNNQYGIQLYPNPIVRSQPYNPYNYNANSLNSRNYLNSNISPNQSPNLNKAKLYSQSKPYVYNQNQNHLDFEDNYRLQQEQFPNPFIRYKIIPIQKMKMALDVTTIDKKGQLEKGSIIIWDYHGGHNQTFYLKRANSFNPNQYYIINASTGFVLEVPNCSRQNNEQVVTNPRFGQPSQVWTLESIGDPKSRQYKILSFCGKALDVKHQWMKNGTPVIQYDNKDEKEGKNQRWKIWPS